MARRPVAVALPLRETLLDEMQGQALGADASYCCTLGRENAAAAWMGVAVR